MTRYVGQKHFNWPAAILICGWMALSVPIFFFPGVLSLFPRVFEAEPLAWWPELDFVGFALTMSPMVLGGVAIWLMPQVDWSVRFGAALVGLGTALFLAGVAWQLDSGIAVYPDRIIHREPGIARPLRVERFEDIRRIQVSCSLTRRRRSSTWDPLPIYEVFFASGYRADRWTSSGLWADLSQRLRMIRLVDDAAVAAKAVRAPYRRPDGSLIGDAGCVSLLAERNNAEVATMRNLFRVDQSELRTREYVTSP